METKGVDIDRLCREHGIIVQYFSVYRVSANYVLTAGIDTKGNKNNRCGPFPLGASALVGEMVNEEIIIDLRTL